MRYESASSVLRFDDAAFSLVLRCQHDFAPVAYRRACYEFPPRRRHCDDGQLPLREDRYFDFAIQLPLQSITPQRDAHDAYAAARGWMLDILLSPPRYATLRQPLPARARFAEAGRAECAIALLTPQVRKCRSCCKKITHDNDDNFILITPYHQMITTPL